MDINHIFQVGNVLLSPDIITEQFCCDLDVCHGICCVEGDAGAPVTLDEIMELEDCTDTVWEDLTAQAQAVIDKQGVAYTDQQGDLVTSIVGGKDCVFTCHETWEATDAEGQRGPCDICLCALERAHRNGRLKKFVKPISCALYPIREKTFADGTVGLNYHRWDICRCGVTKGKELGMPLYRFLEGPLVRRFGQEWYDELCGVAEALLKS